MRLTLYGFPSKIIKSFHELPNDFKFTAPNFSFECSKIAAIEIAPIIRRLLEKDPYLSYYDIESNVMKPYLVIFFNVLRGNQVVISRKNSHQFLALANELENEDLKQSVLVVTNKKISPKDVISYIFRQKEIGLNISHDIRYIASHFLKFYRDPSLTLLTPEILRQIIESTKISKDNKRLAKNYYHEITKQKNTLENYFVISSALTRNAHIELKYEEDNELLGIIANLTSLASKNVYVARAVFLEAPVPVKNIQNIVDLKNPEVTIRILCNGLNYIHYDFRERKISLTSLTIQVGDVFTEAPKHWALVGSNDNNNWEVIIEHEADEELAQPYAIKNYSCNESSFFRYIRFVQRTNFSNRKTSLNAINLSALEFFGKLTVI
ncbi:hypothetical protein TRFO_33439 [Tritrichomonas foetus]|uniref:Uncharacterized protein n=1 Tax=Tritrichomonas foetus TaxID=1144522 RepID=A0A1J4JR39_9EUKA|nr:hypothetical protein TRFO_33439 [Tritrichomonas foetus]|eukprot:OHS99981.1 hypothetical protein TRFO_33439 [Tritrichomonas foetus]